MAVHVLTLMAWADEESLKSEQVAESVNTNPVVIRRMLCELAESKLVVSQTGAIGGSRLAREPEKITLLDIYRAVESPGVFSLHRHPPSRRCPVGVNIGTVLNERAGRSGFSGGAGTFKHHNSRHGRRGYGRALALHNVVKKKNGTRAQVLAVRN